MHMANKTATVTARINPEIKEQAEAILDAMGMPVSVLIDTLYRQIIMTRRIPYTIRTTAIPTLDTMNDKEFNDMLQRGYEDALAKNGMDIDEAFCRINENI